MLLPRVKTIWKKGNAQNNAPGRRSVFGMNYYYSEESHKEIVRMNSEQ